MTSNFSLTDLKITKNGVTQSFLESLYPTIFASSICFMFSEPQKYPGWLRPRGALFSLQALLGAPGGPYRSLKWARVLDIYAVHPGGLTAGIWSQIWVDHINIKYSGPFRDLYGPPGAPKRPCKLNSVPLGGAILDTIGTLKT